MSKNLDFHIPRAEKSMSMSRNGECKFSIPRVYFVLQSRYGDKEDRRVECIFVEWRVFIGDMLPPSLPLSPPPFPPFLGVSYRVDYVAPSATVNFGERGRSVPRERKIDLFPRKSAKYFRAGSRDAKQVRHIKHCSYENPTWRFSQCRTRSRPFSVTVWFYSVLKNTILLLTDQLGFFFFMKMHG